MTLALLWVMAISARYDGFCKACGKNYSAGTQLVKGPHGWQHEKCGQPSTAPTVVQVAPATSYGSSTIANFTIRFPYDQNLIDAFRAKVPQPQRHWNPEQKTWTVQAEHLGTVATLVEKLYPEIATALREGPEFALARQGSAAVQATREASRATDADIEVPRPDGLDYLPYQKAGIAYAMARPATLIADEMGLGKTIQAIGLINADTTIRRVLVICPASLRLNWKRELEKWLTRPLTVGIAEGKDWPANVDVVVINYDILSKHANKLHSETFDLCITDEAHYLKNPKALRTSAVLGKWDKDPSKVKPEIKAKRRVFMTGTPIVNRPAELWTLLHALDRDGLGRSWKGYMTRYANARETRYGWDVSGAANLSELQDRLRATLMVRRLKKDVLTELPPKRRQVIEIPANGAGQIVRREQAAWNTVQMRLEGLRDAVEAAAMGEDEEAYKEAVAALAKGRQVEFTEMAALRHETALAKVEYIVEHLLNTEEPVVLFAHHKDVIEAIVTALREAERRVVVVTGDTPMQARQDAVDAFQAGNADVFVGNIQAAGVGLTLTASSHVVFAELDWVPGNVSQAEDRTHRIGQTQSVLVQHLVLEGSLDATMARTLTAKQEIIDAALDKTEAQEPVSPVEPRATWSQLEREAKNFTPEMTAAVHTALRMLAGVCDGAVAKDDMGFNGADTKIGHRLAACASLTPKQAALGRKIVRKYHRQLPAELIETMKTTQETTPCRA